MRTNFMTSLSRALLAVVALTGCATSHPEEKQSLADGFRRIVHASMEKEEIPGAAVVVMKGDDVVYAEGFGVEDVTREQRVTPSTSFYLGSSSKMFVAAAIVRLAEQGRLQLDDSITKYLPEAAGLSKVTVRHLLSHTSGIRDEHVQPKLAELYDLPGTPALRYFEEAARSPIDFAPGSRWSYANINYLLASFIVERVAKMPLDAAIDRLVIEPARTPSLRFCPDVPGLVPGEARGHIKREGRLTGHPPEPIDLFRGAGGYCGNALDLAKWLHALASGRIVSRASYAEMTTPARLAGGTTADYGLGISLAAPDAVERQGHGGYGGGFAAQSAYYPSADLTVVVLRNRFVYAEHIERKISRRMLGLREPPDETAAADASNLDRYTGAFDVGVKGWHPTVSRKDDQLVFALPEPHRLIIPLRHIGEHRFVSASDPDGYQLRFSPDGTRLELFGMGMMTWYGMKLP